MNNASDKTDFGIYSDFFKMAYGFRPRSNNVVEVWNAKTAEEQDAELDRLSAEWQEQDCLEKEQQETNSAKFWANLEALTNEAATEADVIRWMFQAETEDGSGHIETDFFMWKHNLPQSDLPRIEAAFQAA